MVKIMVSLKDQRDQSAGSNTHSISRELIAQSQVSQDQELDTTQDTRKLANTLAST